MPAAMPSDGEVPREAAEVVVVITIDGVRYQEVFDGVDEERARRAGLAASAIVDAATLMPNLHWLVATRGAAIGAPGRGVISASGPSNVSLPGYVELFTGDRAVPCTDNRCPPVQQRTIADDLAIDGDPSRVAVFASWKPLARATAADPSRMLVSAGRSGTNRPPLLTAHEETRDIYERGERAAPAPGYADYRPDEHTAALALAYLRRERPRFLFIGLGDTDELAHQADYAGYLRALSRADRLVGDVAITLGHLSDQGTPTLLIVTTDHGRAHDFPHHGSAYPESARTWLVAAGEAVRARGRVRSPGPRYLADVTATLRALTDAPTATGDPGVALRELFVPATPLLASR